MMQRRIAAFGVEVRGPHLRLDRHRDGCSAHLQRTVCRGVRRPGPGRTTMWRMSRGSISSSSHMIFGFSRRLSVSVDGDFPRWNVDEGHREPVRVTLGDPPPRLAAGRSEHRGVAVEGFAGPERVRSGDEPREPRRSSGARRCGTSPSRGSPTVL